MLHGPRRWINDDQLSEFRKDPWGWLLQNEEFHYLADLAPNLVVLCIITHSIQSTYEFSLSDIISVLPTENARCQIYEINQLEIC